MPDTLLLIDLSAIYWAAWHGTANAPLSTARENTIMGVRRCVDAVPGAHVAVCCDSPRSFRKDIDPNYKAQRPEKDHAAVSELQTTIAQLSREFLMWKFDTFEADDVIASATQEALVAGWNVVIATGDKDLFQLLVDPRVRIWAVTARPEPDGSVGNRWRAAEDVKAKFGVTPSQIGDLLALMGDASDNIKGCPGVGLKRAAEILAKFGTIHGMYADLRLGSPVYSAAIDKALLENEGAVGLAKSLVDLRFDVPVKIMEAKNYRAPVAQREEAPMPEELEAIEAEETPAQCNPEAAVYKDKSPVREVAPAELMVTPTRDVSFDNELEPHSSSQALIMAKLLYEGGLYARKFTTPHAIYSILVRGREMGLRAGEALDSFHCVEGAPYASAHLLVALAKRHRDCEYLQCVETTDTSCTWETKNRNNPKPTRLTYTIQDAELAGMLKPARNGSPSNYVKRPKELLRKTCVAQLARMEFPDACLGLYCAEEVGG